MITAFAAIVVLPIIGFGAHYLELHFGSRVSNSTDYIIDRD
jgi:hypothetical protein